MILIVDMNFKKDSLGTFEFVLPIVSIVKELDEFEVKHFSETNLQDISHYDKIILSGTALKDHATLQQPKKFEWIRNCPKPILGICAGMQTIGVVFGLRLNSCVEIGMAQISTLTNNPLFSSKFDVYELHNYSLPESADFNVLAESKVCLQAVKHKQKSIYGVLFHPEVRNKEILQHFILLKS